MRNSEYEEKMQRALRPDIMLSIQAAERMQSTSEALQELYQRLWTDRSVGEYVPESEVKTLTSMLPPIERALELHEKLGRERVEIAADSGLFHPGTIKGDVLGLARATYNSLVRGSNQITVDGIEQLARICDNTYNADSVLIDQMMEHGDQK